MLLRRLFISLLILSALTADGTASLADYVYNLNLYSGFGLDLHAPPHGQTALWKDAYVNRHDTVVKRTLFCSESFEKLSVFSFDDSYNTGDGILCLMPENSSIIFTEVNKAGFFENFLLPDVKDIVLLQSDSSPPLVL